MAVAAMARDLALKLRSCVKNGFYAAARRTPSDVWICSYPRSGNTWMRRMLCDIYFRRENPDAVIWDHIPDIHMPLPLALAKPAGGVRYYKSHFPYSRLYPKTVYILRDPINALISYWRRSVETEGQRCSLEVFVQRELQGGRFGAWHSHVISYLKHGFPRDRLMVVRYEDLLDDPALHIAKVIAFSGGREVDPNEIRYWAEVRMDAFLARKGVPVSGMQYEDKCRQVTEVQSSGMRGVMETSVLEQILRSPVGVLREAFYGSIHRHMGTRL